MSANYDLDNMKFDLRAAQKSLYNPNFLDKAFIFSKTPQGSVWWEKNLDNGLSKEARDILIFLIDAKHQMDRA